MKRTIRDIDVKGKRVLLRVDFNVPLDDSGVITDASRIVKELPTIKYLLSKGAKVIICSHLGRPKGQPNEKYSLLPVAKYLVQCLNCKIKFSSTTIGPEATEKVNNLQEGEVLVLENVRFYKEEEEDSLLFASKLAELADIYVNDAFGTAHRKHASTYSVAKLLPNAVGFLMGKEINTISSVLEKPEHPFIAIMGGAKVSDKLNVVHSLVKKCDAVLIGGGMAYTFLAAKGVNIGNSLYEPECLDDARKILEEAAQKGVKILLPIDHICSTVLSPNAIARKIKTQDIPDNLVGLDIGPNTIKAFVQEIKNARTIIWNGPMGVFEFKNFRNGTKKVALAVAKNQCKSIVGGGDSISAINIFGVADKIYHISTGGGASLKLISGENLPGVDVMSDKEE